MDITNFVATHREALLIGDYNSYRAQLSRQLLATRKRLGRATAKREKFSKKPVTAEDVGSNHEFAHLLLLTSERAWAHAMHIKTSHTEDNAGITGSTRSHIISRLSKAAKTAHDLVKTLQESSSKANEQDVLEARAYQSSLAGSEEFEKQSEGQRSGDGQASEQRWQPCLRHYAQSRVIYAALLEKEKKEVYREILANTVDPTIRYAAYQAQLSRTIAIPTVAKRYFPKDDQALVQAVGKLDPYALKDKPVPKTEAEKEAAPQEIPNSVTWRGRKANIVDASIGQALANVTAAKAKLRAYLQSDASAASRDKAAAYDDVLIASQDAADATKRATDELEKERVDEGDPRMQDLRVTSLSVNHDLVSWRVGRNRILIGEDDGITFQPEKQKSKRSRKDGAEQPEKEEPRGRQLGRLKERNVLYDATIQSINSVKDLRGAMRDEKFVQELDGKANYFRALKCLNISYSHSLLGNHLNALALLKRALELVSQPLPASTSTSDANSPPTLDIQPATSEKLRAHLESLTSRMHAIVEMRTLEANSAKAAEKNMISAAPLVQKLNDYPTPGTQVDLTNLVTYPPKIEPVPVKPLFLDVAFNYIDYPGRAAAAVVEKPQPQVNGVEENAPQQPQKKGWFSFGR
ncbi:Signal recognition particle subunit SRP68 [Fulvia fulva]|uniref:Signal recognition particle subunit SRP68 n=1 Tax=Passalora fulva TaxID=5499 RepID=A0A9Q8LAP9_PASFU|nr:Signal recognition particle subunit SRP68 [Fulvia fulva]KAK4632678.1 Signal recognition particle subunit SRP68 [Fulvia fulva]UJO13794.1 Signal recognition particle subunit SRP68 [Fulvia fulva]WPV10438.1 Signal recognition particle subunit SRP68 [Fulvia fulva]